MPKLPHTLQTKLYKNVNSHTFLKILGTVSLKVGISRHLMIQYDSDSEDFNAIISIDSIYCIIDESWCIQIRIFIHDLAWQLAEGFITNTVKMEKYECVVLHDDESGAPEFSSGALFIFRREHQCYDCEKVNLELCFNCFFHHNQPTSPKLDKQPCHKFKAVAHVLHLLHFCYRWS